MRPGRIGGHEPQRSVGTQRTECAFCGQRRCCRYRSIRKLELSGGAHGAPAHVDGIADAGVSGRSRLAALSGTRLPECRRPRRSRDATGWSRRSQPRYGTDEDYGYGSRLTDERARGSRHLVLLDRRQREVLGADGRDHRGQRRPAQLRRLAAPRPALPRARRDHAAGLRGGDGARPVRPLDGPLYAAAGARAFPASRPASSGCARSRIRSSTRRTGMPRRIAPTRRACSRPTSSA